MTKKKRMVYGPNQRGYFEIDPPKMRSYSKVDYTPLPNPIQDSIVTNNIAYSEFDYTYNGEEDIWGEDYWDDYF
ncbi:hypothetical protein [Clostridium sp. JNZ J1-5]